VEGRINALARVHTVLSLSSWQGAEIRRLIDEELAPYSVGDQISLFGSELQLLPATAQTIALALHEPRHQFGQVRRAVDAVGAAFAEVGERAGPAAVILGRDRRASGSGADDAGLRHQGVIASIESQLGGEAKFDWRREGLLCRLSVPLSPTLARPDSAEQQSGVIEIANPERAARSADA